MLLGPFSNGEALRDAALYHADMPANESHTFRRFNVFDVARCALCAQVIYEDIMRWLYSLHLRAPGATVLLVANQCDGSLEPGVAGSATSVEELVTTATLVEKRTRKWLKQWQDRRGILGNGQPMRCRPVAADVTVLPQVRVVEGDVRELKICCEIVHGSRKPRSCSLEHCHRDEMGCPGCYFFSALRLSLHG